MISAVVDAALWVIAIVLGAAPKWLWHHLDSPLPLASAASASGLLGFVIGVPGFHGAEHAADVNNSWMVRTIAAANPSVNPHTITNGV